MSADIPISPPADYNTTISDGDAPMSDTAFLDATLVLVLPFVLIPLSVICARLVKYSWRIYQAKKYGFGDDILQDPLAELGLKVRRGYDTTADIRKIRREANRLKKEAIKRNTSTRQRDHENQRILGSPGSADAPRGRTALADITDFVRIPAAEEYLKQLHAQTKKTWFDLLSPDAVRRWVNVSGYARLWMMVQVTCTFLAIVNYVALTYLANRDDRDERALIKNLDIAYASFFLLDYCLSFYIAEDRLQFYFNPMSLIDLMSIVSPFVYLFIASPTKYVWFIGFIRIFRATRILRTYRLLSFTQSEETRELTIFTLNFLNFIFFAASIINATEALNFESEAPSLQNWHDSLYYIMVTFSTIGFGDLTPSSTISRVVVMFLIILVIIYIPWQTGKIIEIFNSMSKYQRAIYSPKSDTSHVILTGSVNYNAVVDFCREFFSADDYSNVVILSGVEPDISMRRLLNHPFYRTRLSYLRGDQMSLQDLKRAQSSFATGMFVLTTNASSAADETEETIAAYESDTQILLGTLYAKSSFPGLPIFAQVSDYRSQDLASSCGVDRLVCIDELKASLFANNCMCPGIQTLILNLIHSYKNFDAGSMKDFWTQEYQCGLVNQIQSFRIPPGLVGLPFGTAAAEIYNGFNCMVFALASVNSGFNQNQIRFLIDKNYQLRMDDIAFCIGDGSDELSLRIALHFKAVPTRDLDSEQRDLEIELDTLNRNKSGHAQPATPIVFSPANPSSYAAPGDSEFADITLGTIPSQLCDHIIVTGSVSLHVLLQFVKAIRERRVNSVEGSKCGAAHKDTPIVVILENIPGLVDAGSVWSEILSFHSIFVLKGRSVQKQVLEKGLIAKCNRIVIFSKFGAEGSDAQSVFLVKLIQKEWPHVKFLVELIDGANVKYLSQRNLEWDNNNLRMQSILNNYALGLTDRQALYRQIRTEGLEKTMLIYQILQFMTAKPDKPKPAHDPPR
ncbi:hypothetical protein HDU91_005201, partial [Kappamyces sp. JEL0680]